MISSNCPISLSASTWSSCLPAGKLRSSDLSAETQEAPDGTYRPSRAIRPRMDWALTDLKPLSIDVGLSVALSAVKEWTNARFDLTLLLCPGHRLPDLHQIAKSFDPGIRRLLPPEVQHVHAAFRIEANNDVGEVPTISRDGIIR